MNVSPWLMLLRTLSFYLLAPYIRGNQVNKIIPAIIFALTATLSTNAFAQDRLVFGNFNSKASDINRGFITPWVEKMASAQGGPNIKTRYGPLLVDLNNFYDRVIDGVADMAFGVPDFNPGRFTNSQASLAACKMYKSGAFGEEFNDVIPLVFGYFPDFFVHTTKAFPIEEMESIDGLKLISLQPPTSEMLRAFGAQTLSIGLEDSYQALQRGTAGAVPTGRSTETPL